MTNAKPTAGKWHTGGISNPGTDDRYCSIWSATPPGYASGDQVAQYVRPEDAEFICAAKDVFEDTGMTPRQLAEKLTEWSIVGRSQEEKIATLTKQRNDLLAALELVVSAPEAGWGLVDAINVLGQCKKAIASAKGGAS